MLKMKAGFIFVGMIKRNKYFFIPLMLVALPYVFLVIYLVDRLTLKLTKDIFLMLSFFISFPSAAMELIFLQIFRKNIGYSESINEQKYRWLGIIGWMTASASFTVWCIFLLIWFTD